MAVDEGNDRAGWLMNRMSLHEPIVIFNVESVSFRSIDRTAIRAGLFKKMVRCG